LTLYALLGFVALFCRNWSTKILMRVATVLFLIPLFGLGGCLWLDPYANMAPNDSWMELGEWIEADMQSDDSADGAALNQSVSSQSAADDTSDVPPPRTITTRDEKLAAFIDDLKAFFRFLDDEKRIYQSGSYIEMCLHRTVYFVFFNVKSAILVAGWRSLAMFLLGVVLIRRGLMMAPNRHAGFFRRLAVYGIALGASVEAAGYYVYLQYPDVFLGFYVYLICLYAGSLGLSLGYLALLTLACTRNRGRSILRPFAAVGRMALTNYLGHSILCNLIFYGYGLALFGRLPFWAIFLIALGIFVAQLCLSPLWLRHFHFGPFEWLWRSLTYPRRQPFRRAGTRH
ncbi:MAG: DUF418 domain-containing protein, partial [Phycisphaerae bacterium]